MRRLTFLLCVFLFVSAFAFSQKDKEKKNYPMFWTWLDYRPDMNFDSVCINIKETGIEGLLLNAATPDDYRKAIPIANKYGIEVYAWIWTMNLEHDRETILKEHPDWFSVNRKGESLANTKAYVDYYKFMCPALPEVREYLKNKVKAFCEVEGLNGIAIDYHRFVDVVLPTTLWPRYGIVQDREYPEWDFGYHPAMIKLFKDKFGYDPRQQADPSKDQKWLQFRCDQITEVANEIADVVHSYGKSMSASPFPTPALARAMVRQDWGKWKLDIVFPMVYHNFYTGDVSFIEDCTIDNVKQKNSMTTLYCGMTATDGDEMFDCMNAALNNGAEGISIFTISMLRSPDIRKRFKSYTDSVKLLQSEIAKRGLVAKNRKVNTNPFQKKKIMEGVALRMKAYLSLAKASKNAGLKSNWEDVEKKAIGAMQVNTASDYIRRLSFPFRWNEKPNPDMLAIADQFKTDNQTMELKPGKYTLAEAYGATKRYSVLEQNSKVRFNVTFYFYGGVISGWNVEPEKVTYEAYRKNI